MLCKIFLFLACYARSKYSLGCCEKSTYSLACCAKSKYSLGCHVKSIYSLACHVKSIYIFRYSLTCCAKSMYCLACCTKSSYIDKNINMLFLIFCNFDQLVRTFSGTWLAGNFLLPLIIANLHQNSES